MQSPSTRQSSLPHRDITVATRIKPVRFAAKSRRLAVRRDKWQKDPRTAAELTAERGKRGRRRKSAIIQESARTLSAIRAGERGQGGRCRTRSGARDAGRNADEPPPLFPPPPRRRSGTRSLVSETRSFNCLRRSAFRPPATRKQRLLSFSPLYFRTGRTTCQCRERKKRFSMIK